MIRIAVSACLLGQPVRYDGTDRNHPAAAALARRFELVPICPEVEIGLGVPRPPIRLLSGGQVVDTSTNGDLTARLVALAGGRAVELSQLRVSGVVLKHKSPSCGLTGVRVFDTIDAEAPRSSDGVGVFSRALLSLLPELPRAQECDLDAPDAIDAFALRVERFHRAAGYPP